MQQLLLAFAEAAHEVNSPSVLSESATVIGYADTSIPDPFAPNCGDPNCNVWNGFKWDGGRKIRLNGLYIDGATLAQGMNDSDVVVGDARTGLIDPISGFPEINAVQWKRGEIQNLETLGGIPAGRFPSPKGKLRVGRTLQSLIRLLEV